MKDGLEKLFRKYLKEQLPPEADWNIPSDEVWDGINSALTGEKERKRPLLLLWLAIGLLSLGLFFVVYRLNLIDKQIIETKQATGPVAIFKAEEEEVFEEQLKSRKGDLLPSSDSIVRIEKKRDTRDRIAEQDKEGAGLTQAGQEEGLSLGAEEYENQKLPFPSFGERKEIKTQGIFVALLARLAPLQVKEVAFVDERRFDKAGSYFARAASAQKVQLSPYFLRFYLGLSATSAPLKGEMSEGFEAMIKSDKAMPAYFAGVDVGSKLGRRLGVFTGLRYQTVNLWSLSKLQAAFDSSTEEPDVGGFMKSMQVFDVPSQVGMMQAEVVLRYPSSLGMASGDSLRGGMETFQNLQSIQWPLGLSYEFVSRFRFSFVADVGLAWNKVLATRVRLAPKVIYGGYAMQSDVVSLSEMSFPNYWEAFGGFTAMYHLNARSALTVHTGYRWALKSHFTMAAMTSRLSSLNLAAGFSYRF